MFTWFKKTRKLNWLLKLFSIIKLIVRIASDFKHLFLYILWLSLLLLQTTYNELIIQGNWIQILTAICALPVVAKIISKIILEPLKQQLYWTIDAEQAGFRTGSSCTEHINTIPILIEQCTVVCNAKFLEINLQVRIGWTDLSETYS